MKYTTLACCTLTLLALAAPLSAAPSDQYKLLAHNVFFLPSTIKPGWGQEERARLIAQADYMKGQDAVILNELFDNPAAAILLDGLKSEYPHQTPILGRSRSGWDATLGAYSDTTAASPSSAAGRLSSACNTSMPRAAAPTTSPTRASSTPASTATASRCT